MKEARRLSIWMSATERRALELEAKRQNCTLNHVVRTSVRSHLGSKALQEAAESVVLETGNQE